MVRHGKKCINNEEMACRNTRCHIRVQLYLTLSSVARPEALSRSRSANIALDFIHDWNIDYLILSGIVWF